MSELTKSFPIEVIIGITSGICLGKFGDIHECAEFVAGHSIWTHEFADRTTMAKIRLEIGLQHPQLIGLKVAGMDASDVPAFVAGLRLQFGDTLLLSKGPHERTESPLVSLARVAPHIKPIVIVDRDSLGE